MYGQGSHRQYGSGERPQAYTTDGNQTRQSQHGQQLEHPYTTTNQSPVRVQLPSLSGSNHTAPTSGRSAMHTNLDHYTESQTQHVSGREPQLPAIEATDLHSVNHNQIRHSTQGHQSEYPYTHQTYGRLPPVQSLSHPPPQAAGDPGLTNPSANPEDHMLHDRQNHDLGYVQQPQYLPWSSQPAYSAISQEPQQYPGPRIGYGAGDSARRHARSLGMPVPADRRTDRRRRLPPIASTIPQPLRSQIGPEDRLRNFTTWEDARSYLVPLRQHLITPPTDRELSDFMHRLMGSLGVSRGSMTREATIGLAQFMLQNDVLNRLEQRGDYRHMVSRGPSGMSMAQLHHQMLRVLLGLWHAAVRDGRITGADMERYMQEGSEREEENASEG